MLLHHLRHALRMMVREPAFSAAAILTLALGVGANVAVFAVVESVLLRPLPYADAEKLVILNHRDRRTGITKPFIAMGDYVDLAARQTTVERLVAYGSGQATIFGDGEPLRVSALSATAGLFETLRVSPALGRELTAADSRQGAAPVAIVGYETWQTYFGSDPAIVGRSVRVGTERRQIVGVAPPGFRFPPGEERTELILPMRVPEAAPAERKSGWVFAVARLKPGIVHRSGGDERRRARRARSNASTHRKTRGRSTSRSRCGIPSSAIRDVRSSSCSRGGGRCCSSRAPTSAISCCRARSDAAGDGRAGRARRRARSARRAAPRRERGPRGGRRRGGRRLRLLGSACSRRARARVGRRPGPAGRRHQPGRPCVRARRHRPDGTRLRDDWCAYEPPAGSGRARHARRGRRKPRRPSGGFRARRV